jgi:NADPH:quinone reductase-like Zn-dependent oxidoreductase
VNDRPGAFAEYLTAPYDLLWAVPESLTLEAASTISMCGLTAAQGIFYRLGFPCPFDTTIPVTPDQDAGDITNVLVYGSSTSVGLYAAQHVHLAASASGRKFRLIGVASASKHEFLRQQPYKYDVLVDYRDPHWIDKVKEATGGKGIDRAIDTISEGETVYKVHDTLAQTAKMAVFRSPGGGKYDISKLQVKPIYGAVWEGLGHEVGYQGE